MQRLGASLDAAFLFLKVLQISASRVLRLRKQFKGQDHELETGEDDGREHELSWSCVGHKESVAGLEHTAWCLRDRALTDSADYSLQSVKSVFNDAAFDRIRRSPLVLNDQVMSHTAPRYFKAEQPALLHHDALKNR